MRGGGRKIPAGAPGHPRTEVDAYKAKAPRPEGWKREGTFPRQTRPAPARVRVSAPRLVYEDETLLAFDKPVGLPVIPPDGSRAKSLLDIATEQVKRRNPKGRAAVVHRIDRDTSGIVIFAIDAKTKKLLMEGWDDFVTERLYVALVVGSMGKNEGLFDSWLKENKAGEVFRAEENEKGAKRAVTRWRVLGEGSGLSLLELALETGRKHQIRVQLADSGHPVVGDTRYGSSRARGESPANDLGRLCLHARTIELKLPGRDTLRIESPPPPEFAAALTSWRGRPTPAVRLSSREDHSAATPKPRSPHFSQEKRASAPRDGVSSSLRGARSGDRPRRGGPRGT
jgi:23S rRNA pseudouridine1911/1915/1917 synthase